LPLHEAWRVDGAMGQALNSCCHPQVPELRVGLSIGLARYQSLYKDVLDWRDDTDKALYTAKHKGLNTISVALSRTATDNADARKVIQNYK
jgi:diguanylate cyclase